MYKTIDQHIEKGQSFPLWPKILLKQDMNKFRFRMRDTYMNKLIGKLPTHLYNFHKL